VKQFTLWLGFGLLFLLNACTGLVPSHGTATPPLPGMTDIPTGTIVWFPPSVTPTDTSIVVSTPTPEQRPGVGGIISTDIFDSPAHWNTSISAQGSAILNRNRLTLAVQPGIYIVSFNQGLVIDDFYAEVTARTSLCKGMDEYGFLVRATAVTYYRYALACNGTVRLERVSVNERHPLYPPTPSGDAPPGAPSEVRLGVWAVGPEMRFFLNGRYQFTVNDTNLTSGTLGVFARSSGEYAVTVSFSDLVVRDIYYASSQETVTPNRTSNPS